MLDYYVLSVGGFAVQHSKRQGVWTVAEAKARLSEILRLAATEGPQTIGTRRPFVVVPAEAWYAKMPPRKPFGQWLIDNMPRRIDLEIPSRREPERAVPFRVSLSRPRRS